YKARQATCCNALVADSFRPRSQVTGTRVRRLHFGPRMIVTSEPSSGIELEARAGPVRRRAESLERLLGHFRRELEQLLRLGTCSRELLLDKIALQANGLR